MKNTVLIVDDDPEIVQVVSMWLTGNGYKVITAKDGNEGIKITKQENPDLIIMDIMMPNLEGGDAVRQLRADVTTKYIPIIFLTAVTANMPEGTDVNVDGQLFKAISKPFDPKDLLMEVKKLLGDI